MVTVVWSMFLPGHMSHHSHFGDPQDICTIGDAAVMGRDCGYTIFFLVTLGLIQKATLAFFLLLKIFRCN